MSLNEAQCGIVYNCCWLHLDARTVVDFVFDFLIFDFFFFCQTSTLKRTMFAIRIPTF